MSGRVGCGGWEARRKTTRRVGGGTGHDGVYAEADGSANGFVEKRRGTWRQLGGRVGGGPEELLAYAVDSLGGMVKDGCDIGVGTKNLKE